MSSRGRSGSGIFLMEMIVVCGFFLLCAVVCVQVFVRADAMSRLAREKNQAVLAAQSIMEQWKAGGLGEESRIWFDEEWNPLEDEEEGWYTASLREETEGGEGGESLDTLTVSIVRGKAHPRVLETGKDGKELILTSLQACRYGGKGAKSGE